MKGIYLKNNQIDKDKWNKALSKCVNQYTYAYSWYLDTVCANWDALVSTDYTVLMPLPNQGKFYLTVFQPLFVPKLGVFYSENLSKADLNIFINDLPSNIKEFNLNFNKYNSIQNRAFVSRKYYYTIDLYDSYFKLFDNYSAFLRTNISNAKNNKNYLISGLSPNEIIAFLNKTEYFHKSKDYDTLRRVLSVTSLRKLSFISAVFSNKNELLGVGVFILSSYTADLMVISAVEDNEQVIALIIDKFIKTNSGKSITLNFECNQNGIIDKVSEEFGAKRQYVEKLSFNKLPRLFKLFSKNK